MVGGSRARRGVVVGGLAQSRCEGSLVLSAVLSHPGFSDS